MSPSLPVPVPREKETCGKARTAGISKHLKYPSETLAHVVHALHINKCRAVATPNPIFQTNVLVCCESKNLGSIAGF